MIYDCFLFFKELDLLEIRLNILNDFVDYFVICESDKTFTGIHKGYVFQENMNRFDKFVDKIIYKKMTFNDKSPWENERLQRNSILPNSFNIDDTLIMSDIDEIPAPSCIEYFTHFDSSKITHCSQRLFYYKLNNELSLNWYGTRIANGNSMFYCTPNEIRTTGYGTDDLNNRIEKNGGWHFSYLGDSDFIKDKIKSFSHTEFNTPEILNSVEDNISKMKDLFGRNIHMTTVTIDNSFPEYIQNNKDSDLLRKYII